MEISNEMIGESLSEHLGREATIDELITFVKFLESDIPEWIHDNLTSWPGITEES